MSALLKEMEVLLDYVWGTLSKIETMTDNKMNFIHQTIFIQIIAFYARRVTIC